MKEPNSVTVKVYYWKDGKGLEIDEDNLPTIEDLMTNYAMVANMGMTTNYTPNQLAESIYHDLNVRPDDYILQSDLKSKGVRHTSMSIGDIIIMEFNDLKVRVELICMPMGFKDISCSI